MDLLDSLMNDSYDKDKAKSKSKSKSKSRSKSKSKSKYNSRLPSPSSPLSSSLGETIETKYINNTNNDTNIIDEIDLLDMNSSILDNAMNRSHITDTYVAKSTSKISLLNQRRVGKWVSDDSVTNCYKCDTLFTYLERKHHCRLCGRIFCIKCSKYKAIIPKDIIDKIPEKNSSYFSTSSMFNYGSSSDIKEKPKPKRVCGDCNKYINSIISIRKVIKVFDYAGLSIRELLFIRNSDCNMTKSSSSSSSVVTNTNVTDTNDTNMMSSLNKAALLNIPDDWREAAEFCIEKFRDIHNKLSTDEFNDNEIRMLWINKNDLITCDRWLVKLLISISSDVSKLRKVEKMYNNAKHNAKRNAKCTNVQSTNVQSTILNSILYHNNNNRNSLSPIVRIENIIGLIVINNNYLTFSTYVGDSIMNTELIVLKDYLPVFITYINTNMYLLEKLIDRCRIETNEDILMEFLTSMYWSIKTFIQTDGLRTSCLKSCMDFVRKLDNEVLVNKFIVMTKNIRIDDKWIKSVKKSNMNEIILPICSAEVFVDIDEDNIIVKNSCSRPIIVPFIRSDGSSKLIMYKKDDIRKDMVILNIINIMHRLLNEELDINVKCVKYNVMPTTYDEGYIEIVPNASTVFNISQTSNIQNYIMEHNDNITVGEIKERFIKSTALYCVISYLLGFGDRHLENIMISEDGYLFHIDFGYIIGQDPKGSDNRSLRVTPGILSVIGDVGTKNHKMFGKYCTKIYSCLRKHVDIFLNILTIIPNIDHTLRRDVIDKEIRERFEVGESNIQAVTHMNMKVRNDSNSFDYMIIDFLHRSKHSTFGQFLMSCKDAVTNIM